jgi:hypothetical protein
MFGPKLTYTTGLLEVGVSDGILHLGTLMQTEEQWLGGGEMVYVVERLCDTALLTRDQFQPYNEMAGEPITACPRCFITLYTSFMDVTETIRKAEGVLFEASCAGNVHRKENRELPKDWKGE